jgi:hypothetical protein
MADWLSKHEVNELITELTHARDMMSHEDHRMCSGCKKIVMPEKESHYGRAYTKYKNYERCWCDYESPAIDY